MLAYDEQVYFHQFLLVSIIQICILLHLQILRNLVELLLVQVANILIILFFNHYREKIKANKSCMLVGMNMQEELLFDFVATPHVKIRRSLQHSLIVVYHQ